MKKIVKTTERNWQCPYCGFLNDLSDNSCKNCGAVRNGDEVEKEVTTNFEETTTTETAEVSDIVISAHKTIPTLLKIIIALLAVLTAAYFIIGGVSITREDANIEQYTVVSKTWEYTISIGEYAEVKGITSYIKPPADATNIETKQVMQSNGWYKTEYTYDYFDWKVVRTETITGEDDVPTFKEYSVSEGEKIMETSEVRYMVTVNTSSGKKNISVSKAKWITLIPGKVYSSNELP